MTLVSYSCQIYQLNNSTNILFELVNADELTAPEIVALLSLTGTIFKNISILYSPNTYQIDSNPYVILKIKDLTNIISSNTASNKAFCVIQLLSNANNNNAGTVFNQSTSPVHSVVKYFNPPLASLPSINIELLNYDGSPYNCMGQENYFEFIVSLLNQPGKYANYINAN